MDREVRETQALRYRCRCNRERLLQHLVLLSDDDRDHLRGEDGTIEADCAFCGSKYVYTPAELVPAVN